MKSKFFIKLVTLVLVIAMTILSTTVFAAESRTIVIEPVQQKLTFSQDTIITEDNMNDILEYYGLNANAAIKKNEKANGLYYNKAIVTVRDLETAIEKIKQLPDKITIDDNNPNVSVLRTYATSAENNSTTVHRDVDVYTHFTVRYSASGQYAVSETGDYKYWTAATGGNIEGLGSSGLPGTVYDITDIEKCTTTLGGSGVVNRYLQLDYKYEITSYVGVNGFMVPVSKSTVDGMQRFGNSLIP